MVRGMLLRRFSGVGFLTGGLLLFAYFNACPHEAEGGEFEESPPDDGPFVPPPDMPIPGVPGKDWVPNPPYPQPYPEVPAFPEGGLG